jgi:hypothetical protein
MLPSHKSKSLLIFALVTLGLCIAPNQAKAVTLTPLTSQDAIPGFDDADFRALINTGQFTELFVAEGRVGNNSSNTGERELGINTANGTPVGAGNFAWGNGKVWDFRLEYTGSAVNYQVFDANQTISLFSQAFSGPVNQIYLRTFANRGSGNNLQNTVSLTDLVFNGTSIGSLSSSGSANSDVDYLGLSNFSAPFTLTGKTALSWVGSAPSRSNLAFQIKVGNSPQSVPEPGILGGICLAAAMGATVSKRKKVAA